MWPVGTCVGLSILVLGPVLAGSKFWNKNSEPKSKLGTSQKMEPKPGIGFQLESGTESEPSPECIT
jgi:hypothetical protein